MSSNKERKACVIGAGIGGLATSIRLANKGFSVDLFEANSYVGGKVTEIRSNAYRFDAGPSLFTLPEILDELFIESGEKPEDNYSYHKVDVITKYFYPNGKIVHAYSDPEKFVQELESQLGEPAQNTRSHLQMASKQYLATKDVFLFNSMQKLDTYKENMKWEVVSALPSLNAFQSMHSANQNRFDQEESVQFFDRYATYNGSNPYQAPATLNLIAHLEHNIGAYFMKGGIAWCNQSTASTCG